MEFNTPSFGNVRKLLRIDLPTDKQNFFPAYFGTPPYQTGTWLVV
jgi:hypothetical protein